MSNEILILDGDEIAYDCACVGEKRSILVTHSPSGRQKTFKNRTEFRAYIKDKFDEELFIVKDVQTAADFSVVRKIIKAKTEALLGSVGVSRFEIYLSGDNNFRLLLPTKIKYKSDRVFSVRPVHLKAAKDYLVANGAIVAHDREADDLVAQRMFDGYTNNQKIIGCTVDKDARMNLGWLLNPDKLNEPPVFIDGFGSITKNEKGKIIAYGRLMLYFQLLQGDATDSYDPRDWLPDDKKPRFGEVAVYKLLKDCVDDKQAVAAVVKKYKEWYPEPFDFVDHMGTEHKGFTWLDCLQVMADCAYMRRSQNDRWDAKAVVTALGVDNA